MKYFVLMMLACVVSQGCNSSSYDPVQEERERRASELQYEMEMDMLEFQRDVTNGYSDAYGSPHFD
ncbi:hypothetical protein [Rubinisphaera brasiliensis]|uniref:Uncharacterized protein n=1 Tax=Rubinisphaera brasiliensis (strain ATCC 49424 / DSM 5305 / JCM 21570 / IAM 15109 / NBRC 103401 / IFAM 1448) TaxID=756272 RepID=F0SR55_RUBBR|nr:hypothetical protein [Rubinisphaera brasiliensis]ADY61302.1 hypothetical protein Plabr_3709 [Rubinisphaera brasiliensis DSM 5305]